MRMHYVIYAYALFDLCVCIMWFMRMHYVIYAYALFDLCVCII